MKNKKLVAALGLALAAVLTVGGTLAYLKATTQTATNTFTSDKNISIALREPTWDGYGFSNNASDGTIVNPDVTDTELKALGLTKVADLGFNQAKSYIPGATINKNPQVKNTGALTNGVDAYVAIKVQYYYKTSIMTDWQEVSYDGFQKATLGTITSTTPLNSINFSNTWTKISTPSTSQLPDLYFYNTPLVAATSEVTTPLFTTVTLSTALDVDTIGKLPEFKVVVKAYAVQSGNTTEATAKTELLSMADLS